MFVNIPNAELNFIFSGGIYVCLQHFVGLCANHVKEYSQTNGCKYFLRIQKFKIKPKEQDEPKDKVNLRVFMKIRLMILGTASLHTC